MRASLPATVTGALAVARDSCTLSSYHSHRRESQIAQVSP